MERLLGGGQDAVVRRGCGGGQTLKSVFGDSALSIFVMPPSMRPRVAVARTRHEDEASVQKRQQAAQELEAAPAFDVQLVNDDLETAFAEATQLGFELLQPDPA